MDRHGSKYMTEVIRQGGVLSGAEFAFLIDRLECYLQEAGHGIPSYI